MNLQLFALNHTMQILKDDGGGGGSKKKTNTNKSSGYDPNSIVDYLKQQGQDSSYSARKQLAQQYGITNYKGSGEQNTQLLNMLKNGTTPKASTATPTAGNTQKPTTNNTAKATNTVAPAVTTPSNISGVDSSLTDKITSTYTPSGNVAGAQSNAQGALNTLTGMSAPSVSAETMQALNTPFTASSAYMDAMNYTNSLLQKLSSGRTSYTDQIKDMMNQIQNRDKFSYDVDTDMLFQQALASAMGSGKQAMQDTMGQASALTGGYASTYAQSAGNQAYNAYIEDAYNNLPEYYQMALEAYNMEGQDMYNQLSMLNDADANEYQRMYDSWNANFAQATNMYEQEYGTWRDNWNNAYNKANLELDQQGMAYDQAYKNYSAIADNANTLYENEYKKWQDEVNNAYSMANLQNSDYWSTQDFIENQRQFDADDAYRKSALAQDNEQFLAELGYKNNALAQDQNQFISRYDLNGDGVVNNLDNEAEEEDSLKEPTESQKQKALEAYNTGGEDAYWQYLDSLPSTVDVESIDLFVMGDGADTKGYGELPMESRTYTKTKDTVNGLWGTDNNDIVVDQYGNEYRIDALPESLRKALTKLKKGESYTAK